MIAHCEAGRDAGRTTCAVAECERPAAKDGLCSGHYKRRQRGMPLGGALRPPRGGDAWVWLYEAALQYADAETKQEFDTARHRLMAAASAYAASALQPTPATDNLVRFPLARAGLALVFGPPGTKLAG